jgi:hypothetical protein
MRFVGPVLLVSGCCGAIPATPLVHVSDQHTNSMPLEAFHTPDYSRLEPAQAATYKALHAEVDKLVHTSEFDAALRDVDTLTPTPGAVRISGARFAAMYLHGDADVESLPVCYGFKSGGRRETASTGTYASRHGCADGKAAAADITLRTVTFERANSKKLEEHACAVNSLAHEWAHALTVTDAQDDSGHRRLFDDGKHDHQSDPLASYTVGAVAQCVYLARAHGDVEHFNVRACIEAVGTNSFSAEPCAADWSNRFVTK